MPIHPFVVHFPVVLMTIAAGLYIFSLFNDTRNAGWWAFVVHVAGLVSAVVAILTGDIEEHRVLHDDHLHEMLELHETLAMVCAWGFGLMALWAFLRLKTFKKLEKVLFSMVFCGILGTLLYSAHLGGVMVYDNGAGIRQELLKSPENHDHNHDHDHSH